MFHPFNPATEIDPCLVDTDKFACDQVRDTQNVQGVAQSVPIRIKGEIYGINVKLDLPDGSVEDGLNFGTIRVCDDMSKNIKINNCGKYAVEYTAAVKSSAIKDVFRLTPPQGTIDPSKSIELQVSEAQQVCSFKRLLQTH